VRQNREAFLPFKRSLLEFYPFLGEKVN